LEEHQFLSSKTLMDNARGDFNFDSTSSADDKEVDMWENCDLNSRLKIPKGELHDHAIKHMLMCEVTLVDVSLLIFSFDFLKRVCFIRLFIFVIIAVIFFCFLIRMLY
jgi:hypothetical protein